MAVGLDPGDPDRRARDQKQPSAAISEHEIRALEEIVGSEWVSADPCMLDTYSFYMNPETLVRDGGRWTPRPVAVVLPDHLHRDACEAALDAGKHVLVEKPITRTMEEAKELIDACDEAGVKLMGSHVARYRPQAQLMKKIIALDKKSNIPGSQNFTPDFLDWRWR